MIQICYFTIQCPLILEGSSSFCVLEDIFNALERIGLGLEKKDAVMSEQKRKLVAYHEAGALDHWLVHSRKISFSMVHHWYIQIASHMQKQKHADHIQIMMILYTAVVGKTMNTMHIKSHPESTFAFADLCWSGHAILGALMNDYDMVAKISIIPRGPAGGVTIFMPSEERLNSGFGCEK